MGGRERLSGSFAPAGEVEQIDYEAVFLDVVPGERHVAATTVALSGEQDRRHLRGSTGLALNALDRVLAEHA